MKHIIIPLLLFAVCAFQGFTQTRQDSIRWALLRQMNEVPESELRDVYKNFMQDNFGPGHILKDKKAAADYLRSELNETDLFEGPDYEPTGYRGNFYRVNLQLIKEGTIPFDNFFKAFVKSMKGIKNPSLDQWKKEWSEIENEISHIGLEFENEEADRKEIQEKLDRNEYVMHHSKSYNDASNFHYRIISRQVFEKEILPLISSEN